MDLRNKNFICSQEWEKSELLALLNLASRMKCDRFTPPYNQVFKDKTFLMLFYNPSTRTRLSFECAATELGGHAQWLDVRTIRIGLGNIPGETVEDVAKVMSHYGAGLGIRILEDQIRFYGEGDQLIREFADWADIPVISMAHDKYHPCQGLADIMAWAEWLSPKKEDPDWEVLKGKKLLITWGTGVLARSWSSVQEALLVGSRFGMDVTLAHPEGYDLDPQVIELTKRNCRENGRRFTNVLDPISGYEGSHIVLSRHWVSPNAYQGGKFLKADEIDKARNFPDWTCTKPKMELTDQAIFTHPMPIDRGNEVTNEVASGPRSCIYDLAENRLHIQKALLALTMGQQVGIQHLYIDGKG